MQNGVHHANGHAEPLSAVFPEANLTLEQADPELNAIVQDEKVRQW
jgi:hypothetical protein